MIRHLLILSTLVILLGCASTKPAPTPDAAMSGVPAQSTDKVYQALTDLANLPIFDRFLTAAKATLAMVDQWTSATPPLVNEVNAANARMCPNAVLIAVPALQQKILDVRDMLAGLKAKVQSQTSGGILLLPTITELEYGPKALGGISVETIKSDVRSRLRLVVAGCSPLGLKIMGDVNDLAIKAGIGAVLPGAGAIPGALGNLGF